MSDDGQVGYGKPPKATRFQKGQSGNPAGRAKGNVNFTTLLEKHGSTKVTFKENGKPKTICKREAIVMQIINKAAGGDYRATQQFIALEMIRENKSGALISSNLPLSKEDRAVIQQITERMQTIQTQGEIK